MFPVELIKAGGDSDRDVGNEPDPNETSQAFEKFPCSRGLGVMFADNSEHHKEREGCLEDEFTPKWKGRQVEINDEQRCYAEHLFAYVFDHTKTISELRTVGQNW